MKYNLGVFPCIFSVELTVNVLISYHVNTTWPIVVIVARDNKELAARTGHNEQWCSIHEELLNVYVYK